VKKLIILFLIVLSVGLFLHLGAGHLLTLHGVQSELGRAQAWRAAEPAVAAGGYFLLYALVTAFSLPGAAIMTLTGGALFGLAWGTVLVSFASSLGALLAFLASRYVFHDWVQQRFGTRMRAINRGMHREGAFYLFTLRMVPLFPFFLINLLMGLTPIRAWTYYWVSQVGMLASTLVFVNAGTQLARLDSAAGILSPGLFASFALLSLFPWLAKGSIGMANRRHVYGRWQKPKKYDRNLIVIGAGAGGLVTAYIAAAVKAKVTLIEAHKMGGDCLNYGCVPSKALIKSAKVAHQMREAHRYGLEAVEPRFSFQKVMQRVHEVIRTVEPHDSVERYTDLGVEVLQGYGRIVDPWTVEIELSDGGKQRLTTRSIVIATGARPFVPPFPGIDDLEYVTSDTLWDELAKFEQAPGRMVVLGGGPIGCELSQAFARLGSQVIQIEMAPRLLMREDEEVSDFARATLKDDGVQVLSGHKAVRCERDGARKFIVVERDGSEQRIEFDVLLCAVGRVARLQGYGLETLGIETGRTIETNAYLETLYPNIFAVGDVAGPFQFTHTAAHQAWYAAVNALFGSLKKFKVDYRVIPWTTFLDPEIARVGLNEQEAKETSVPYEVVRYNLDDLDRAIAEGSAHGFIKILTEPKKDRILGVTIVGDHAGELLAEFVLAMKHGLGLNKILGTIHVYPTWAEANKYAAGEWKRAHAPEKALACLKRFHAWQRG
jgi:pyruvate/2-oxoglutarate dehydrogenase complex dihydrolipoamide dehydrogenase (E3) component/uncharacterized membrane protein YdjX (TVP38/TMEM64 family)